MTNSAVINTVDSILKIPFSLLSYNEKFILIEQGRFVPQKQQINLTQKDGKYIRNLNVNQFDMFKWLTYSLEKYALYCYPCLLFCSDNCRENKWCKLGYIYVKHI